LALFGFWVPGGMPRDFVVILVFKVHSWKRRRVLEKKRKAKMYFILAEKGLS